MSKEMVNTGGEENKKGRKE